MHGVDRHQSTEAQPGLTVSQGEVRPPGPSAAGFCGVQCVRDLEHVHSRRGTVVGEAGQEAKRDGSLQTSADQVQSNHHWKVTGPFDKDHEPSGECGP